MIKEIMRAEIKDVLGRNPDADEVKNFMDYIQDAYNDAQRAKKPFYLADVGLLLYEYRNANYHQCEDCGEWYRIGSDEWNNDGYYCVNCKPNHDPDMMPGGHDYY